MSGAARTCDDHFEAALARRSCVVEHQLWRAVCAHDAEFMSNTKLRHDVRSGLHFRQIALATHNDADRWTSHASILHRWFDSLIIRLINVRADWQHGMARRGEGGS